MLLGEVSSCIKDYPKLLTCIDSKKTCLDCIKSIKMSGKGRNAACFIQPVMT